MTPVFAPRVRGSRPTKALAATALALLVAVLTVALTALSAPRAGAQAGTATLTIHNRLCPAGFTGPDYFGTCHGNPAPAGLDFSAEGPESVDGLTDASGNVVFSDLTPGTYTVRGGVPLDFAKLNIACTPAATPGTPYPFTPLPAGGASSTTGAQLNLAAGANVVCDFYNTPVPQGPPPAGADLTIRGRLCPTDYAGSNFFKDCAKPVPAGIEYSVAGPESATIPVGANGNAVFTDLTSGTYTVRGGVPGEFARLVVSCTSAHPPYQSVPFTPLGGGVRGPSDVTGLSIALGIDADVVCSFYNIPEDLSGASPSPSAKPSAAPSAKPSTPPVTSLPDTGAGTRVQGADTSTLLLLAAAVAVATGLGLAARRRNAS